MKTIELQYCQNKDMITDVLTKGLSSTQVLKLRGLLGVREIIE